MGQSEVAAIFLICLALCTGSSDTADRKSSIQYTVNNVDGSKASSLQQALNVIKRDSSPGLRSVLDPDAPLNRMKRDDLGDHLGLKRKKRSVSDVEPVLGNVKHQSEEALKRVKRDSPVTPLKRVKRIDENAEASLQRTKRDTSNNVRSTEDVKRQVPAIHIIANERTKRDVPTVAKPIEHTKRDIPTATKPIEHTKRAISTAAKPIEHTKRDIPTAAKPIEHTKRDIPTATKPIEHTQRDIPTATKPIEHTKRDIPTAAKPIEHTKRDIPTATKPIEINKRAIENTGPVMKPLVKRDLKVVNMPPEKRDIGPSHGLTVNKAISVKDVKRDVRPLAPIIPDQPKVHLAEAHIKSLAENLEEIRREKREIRKAQVALDREAEMERETRMRKRRELRHLREKMEDREDWSALIHG